MENLQQEEIDYMMGVPENWEARQLKKCIYRDDYNCIEKVRQRDAVFHLSQHGRTSNAHAVKSQSVFNNLKRDANEIGMKVNNAKTQMLCISPSINKCNTYLMASDGGRVQSGEHLKLLGFVFDNCPTPAAQVRALVSKFRSRLWSLRYLKKAGMSEEDLCRAYTTYLRPVLEYSMVAIHSMLTREQSETIDRQQIRALKIVFGFDKHTEYILSRSGLDPLSVRRSQAVDRFANKLVINPRYSHLFPLRPETMRRSRHSHRYLEEHARTSRLYNSPLFYMRRRLNELVNEQAPAAIHARNSSQRCDFIFDEWR